MTGAMFDLGYRLFARPALRLLDPEQAHRATICALKTGFTAWTSSADDPILACRVFGRDLRNPIGLAAGFDKHAEVVDAMLALGFGLVEAGTVTPRPQPGNTGTRIFRLDEDEAVINRLGFNSEGIDAFAGRLRRRVRERSAGLVGANIGKNKESTDAAADYVRGMEAVAALADYVVVNISSPNTPGLRALQARGQMQAILEQVLEARERSVPDKRNLPPLVVKIAPDLDEAGVSDIVEVALALAIDGLIVANTTVARPATLRSRHRDAEGGLSGKPLMAPSTAFLANVSRLARGRLVLIGCGGIASGADAYAKIRAGASLVQLYSALVFQGPGLVSRIKRELAACLRTDGFESVAQAVGADHRKASTAGEPAAREASSRRGARNGRSEAAR